MENIWSYSLTVFLAFFAIMNPIVNIPIFVQLTEGVNEKKKKEIAKTANIVAFIIVLAFILIGKYIFEIFGLTIPAFKVFGGILIFFIGFEMLQSKKPSINHHEEAKYDEGVTISAGHSYPGRTRNYCHSNEFCSKSKFFPGCNYDIDLCADRISNLFCVSI